MLEIQLLVAMVMRQYDITLLDAVPPLVSTYNTAVLEIAVRPLARDG